MVGGWIFVFILCTIHRNTSQQKQYQQFFFRPSNVILTCGAQFRCPSSIECLYEQKCMASRPWSHYRYIIIIISARKEVRVNQFEFPAFASPTTPPPFPVLSELQHSKYVRDGYVAIYEQTIKKLKWNGAIKKHRHTIELTWKKNETHTREQCLRANKWISVTCKPR